MPQSTPASPVDRLAMGYQLKQFKIHLPGIIPQISRRVLGQGDTTLAELHHIFQVVMDWENWHLHSFHLWGKDYGLSYAGGTWYADDARRVHLGDFRGGSMISSPIRGRTRIRTKTHAKPLVAAKGTFRRATGPL